MKAYSVTIHFPQAPCPVAFQNATIECSNLAPAVSRAIKTILRRPGVKGRRHHKITITVERIGGAQ
jgi:hypothetical protein